MSKIVNELGKCVWSGDKAYRIPRTIGMAAFGGLALALIGGAVQGEWNPLKFLSNSDAALAATVIVGGMIGSYQIVNMLKELFKKEGDKTIEQTTRLGKFFMSPEGKWRVARTTALAILALSVCFLLFPGNEGDTFVQNITDFFTTHNWNLLSAAIASSAMIGYQAGNWIKSRDVGGSLLDGMKKLVGYSEGSNLLRIPRSLIVLGLGALTLSLLNHYCGDGSMNPIQFLADHQAALLSTIIIGGLFLGHQMGNGARELYNHVKPPKRPEAVRLSEEEPTSEPKPTRWQKVKAVVIEEEGAGYRALRVLTLAILMAGSLALASYLTDGNGDPLQFLKDNNLAKLLTIGIGSAIVGYQAPYMLRAARDGIVHLKNARDQRLSQKKEPAFRHAAADDHAAADEQDDGGGSVMGGNGGRPALAREPRTDGTTDSPTDL